MPRNTSGAAIFRGTLADYHFFIGPSIRNMVQAKTKSRRFGRCANEACSHHGRLDAAHRPGRGRMQIIEDVLSAYRVAESDIIECNLDEVFRRIEAEHDDFDRVFTFICHPCHVALDAEERRRRAETGRNARSPGQSEAAAAGDGPDVDLVPADDRLFKQLLLHNRRAFVKQWRTDGSAEVGVWNAERFRETSNLWSNIRRGYARPERCRRKGIVKIRIAIREEDLSET